ncbi:hypothetical protein KBD18_01565 [Patescibacteria group bacterium]|nr:hypothetical protein [Patescibacteria group bacterium]
MKKDAAYAQAKKVFPDLNRVNGGKGVRYENYPCMMQDGKIVQPTLEFLAGISSTKEAGEKGLVWRPADIKNLHVAAAGRRRDSRARRSSGSKRRGEISDLYPPMG